MSKGISNKPLRKTDVLKSLIFSERKLEEMHEL